MNARKIVLLAVALVIAGGTMMLARSSMTDNKAASPDAPAAASLSTTEILVAARDMPVGTLLKDLDMKWQPWPKEGLTDAFAVKGQKDVKDFVGTMLRQGIRSGEPILAGRVIRSAEQGFMAAVLAPGMRAVTIPITPASGVAGFAFPGDYVDVIVTHKIHMKTTEMSSVAEHKVSETVLSNVRILALDQKTDDQVKDAKPAQLATLEVTPRQAEKLVLATEMGMTSLVLRGLATEQGQKADKTSDEGVVINGASGDDAQGNTDASGPTWDSDVSHALPQPANRGGRYMRIQVMRGHETSETIFDSQ